MGLNGVQILGSDNILREKIPDLSYTNRKQSTARIDFRVLHLHLKIMRSVVIRATRKTKQRMEISAH